MKKLICATLAVIMALAALLLFVPTRSFALEEIELVNQERARELGLQIRSVSAGEGTVHVLLDIPIKGELKDYRRVELRILDGQKLLLSSLLKEEEIKPEHVRVSFYADPKMLDLATLKIVTDDLDGRIGNKLKVKEFVDRTPKMAPSKPR